LYQSAEETDSKSVQSGFGSQEAHNGSWCIQPALRDEANNARLDLGRRPLESWWEFTAVHSATDTRGWNGFDGSPGPLAVDYRTTVRLRASPRGFMSYSNGVSVCWREPLLRQGLLLYPGHRGGTLAPAHLGRTWGGAACCHAKFSLTWSTLISRTTSTSRSG